MRPIKVALAKEIGAALHAPLPNVAPPTIPYKHLGSVSRKILSLEMDLSSLITMVTIVFSLLKITRGLKIF